MDNYKAIEVLEYTKNYDDCSYGAPRIAIDKGIAALMFQLEARDVNELLKEIVDRIENEVLDSLSDGGDDWFASAKVYEAIEIIKEYIKD